MDIECIWKDWTPQTRLPPELWAFDPLQQVIRSCKCEFSLLPFSIAVRGELQYYGDSDIAPFLPPASLISMHSLQIEDVDLFNEDVIVYEVLAVPKLLPQDEEEKKAFEFLLSKFA
jgi:hypothetical protein